ncbi:MAG: TonB-dependent receptor [Chitinophagales bacterium]|nr:TonB-dependent receptor [Chitinophagales bacterium]
MKQLVSLVLLLAGMHSFLIAQSVAISGRVNDSAGMPIEAATISLLYAADSSLVKMELSDATGRFEFSGINTGRFLVAVTAMGYEKMFGNPIEASATSSGIELPPITLVGSAINLNTVTVTARKPFIERRSDRTIVNVESSILATGSTALDILERSPGVVVDQNDAISLRGRSGVIVMIDGKPNPMSGADLSNFLRTLPSNSIERIELITNPSAKYDAAGNAGIIDIRLKKDKNLGTNGSVSANYGQGVYPKAGTGLTLNHRNKKVNVFGAYNYNFRKGMNDLRLYRTFFNNEARTGAYDQRNYLTIPYHTQNARVGADFFPNKKTVIGVVASGNLNRFNPRAQNSSAVEGPEPEVVSYFGTTNRSKDRWFSWAANANVKRTFNDKGHELTADLDLAEFGNQTDQLFTTLYTGLNGEKILPDYLLAGDLQGHLTIRSLKSDYVLPLPGKAKLEAGVKASIVDADNDLQFFDQSVPGTSVYDSTISNHFIYQENINAGYVNYSQEWAKFSVQAGLRAENTHAEGTQLVNGDNFDRKYTNLFPSLFLNYKFSEKYETGFNVSRRLDRPSYQQLNPFKKFLDPSTYSAGNPYLNPQFTWAVEWTQTFWQKLNINLAASRTTDNITQVIAPVGGADRVTIQTDSNLTTVDYASLTVNYNFNITPWWSTINNFNSWIGQYSGNLANTTLSDGNLVAHFFTTHNFKLKKDWSAELNFNYKTREIYGFMDLNPMWGLGAGVQKSFFDRRATLKLAVTDIFWQNLPSATIRFSDYVETFEVFRETRVATVSFNYRFGSNDVQQARRRQGGAEEEKRRAGG